MKKKPPLHTNIHKYKVKQQVIFKFTNELKKGIISEQNTTPEGYAVYTVIDEKGDNFPAVGIDGSSYYCNILSEETDQLINE